MERLAEWEDKLEQYLTKCEKKRFKWGRFDCVIFAAGAFKAVYGTNPLGLLEKQYDGKTSGLKLISKLGDGSLWQACDGVLEKCGMERANVNFSQPGDVVGSLNHEGLEMLGVMEDFGTCTFASEGGLARLPLSEVKVRWAPCQN